VTGQPFAITGPRIITRYRRRITLYTHSPSTHPATPKQVSQNKHQEKERIGQDVDRRLVYVCFGPPPPLHLHRGLAHVQGGWEWKQQTNGKQDADGYAIV
jgi:hypothetical protein